MVEDRFVEMTTSSNMETTMVPMVQQQELEWCIVRKEVVFNHDLCVNAYLEDALP